MLWVWCLVSTSVAEDKGAIIVRDRLPQRHKRIGCPGLGPFASLGECFIICEDAACANGLRACDLLGGDCDAVVRSSHGLAEDLNGQLVELVSLFSSAGAVANGTIDADEESSQHKRSCFEYGQQLAQASVGKKMTDNDAINDKARFKFIHKNGTIMFLHLRKAGGKLELCYVVLCYVIACCGFLLSY
jgi:hypothetical protein